MRSAVFKLLWWGTGFFEFFGFLNRLAFAHLCFCWLEHGFVWPHVRGNWCFFVIDWNKIQQRWSDNVTVIPIIVGVLGITPKNRDKRLGRRELEIWGRIITIQTAVLFRLARIFRKVLETWRDSGLKMNFYSCEKKLWDNRLVVIQLPVKYHQLMLVWKTHKEWSSTKQRH